MILFGQIIAALSIILLLIAALGVLRLPDALSRQHAATKAATIAVSFMIIGLVLYVTGTGFDSGWLIRLSILILALYITLPLASHALAMSAAIEEKSK
jgi:multicomponent Na+:H+ antiporter subunit G